MRWTIGRRLVLSMAVAVTVGMLGLTASLLMVHRQSELAQQEASNRLYTQLIATELAAGIHLKQPELVKRKLTVYERAFVGELAAVEAFAVDFSSLLQSGPSGAAAPPALKALLEREKERLAAGTAVGARVPDGIVAIAPAKLAGDTVVGYLAVQWSTAGLEARQMDSLKAAAIAFAVVLAVVMGLQGWLTARTVTWPIRGMAGVMQRLADGDHTLDVPGRGRSDEIGEIAATVEVFRQRTATIERLERERIEAAGRAAEERRQLLARVAAEFEQSVSRMLSSIGAAVGITEEGAHKLRDAAESTKEQALQTQDHTVRTGDIVRTVEDVTQHLTRTIGEISDRVNDSGAMVKVAATRVRGSDAAVAALSQGSERIGEIIGLINSIAGQTNLLALNATIEAARAGEAGKGFTVVAHEVKALASQTAKATDDIANQVSSIRAATADVVDAMHAIRETIERLETLSAEMQSATGEQVSATREIVSAVAAAARTSTDTSDVVATMARSAAETGKAAVLMIGTARQLSQDVQELTGDTQRFLNSIREA